MCFKSKVKNSKRQGLINGENDGDDSVDPTCVGW